MATDQTEPPIARIVALSLLSIGTLVGFQYAAKSYFHIFYDRAYAETITAAVTAAETGHLVLATLHAGSTVGAIDRIVDQFPEHAQRQVRSQLADVLRVVLAQRLLPSRDGGRVPALEILPITAAVGHLIREGKGHQIPATLQTGREQGMVPMARALAELVRGGKVEKSVALASMADPAPLLEALR